MAAFTDNPGGNPVSLPLMLIICQEIGVSPVADSIVEYAVPVVPSGNEIVVITGGSAIVMVNTLESLPLAFEAVMVKLYTPATVEVPDISSWFNDNPSGNHEPSANDHVIEWFT